MENICKAVKTKCFQEQRDLFTSHGQLFFFFQETSSGTDTILLEFLHTVEVFKVTQNPFQ